MEARSRLRALHIAQTSGGGRGLQLLAVNLENRRIALTAQRFRIVLHECIDGIYGVERGVPALGALLLQKPALHLLDGLRIGRLQQADSLDGGHLSGYLIVEPTVVGLARVEIAAHLLFIYSVLANALQVFLGLLLVAVVTKDDGRICFAVDGELLRLLRKAVDEISLCGSDVGRELAAVDGGEIEPVDGGLTRTHVLCALLLLLLHLFNLLDDLASHERIGIREHVCSLTIVITSHCSQTNHHLTNGNGHVE